MHTHDLYSFFSDNFGFNQRDTVAIMGAHTLGVVRQEVGMNCVYSDQDPIKPFTHGCILSFFIQDFQIDGSNGWVLHNDEFSNQYYAELIGGSSKNDPVSVLVNDAPAWRRTIENGVRFWTGFPNGVRIIMVRDCKSILHQKVSFIETANCSTRFCFILSPIVEH